MDGKRTSPRVGREIIGKIRLRSYGVAFLCVALALGMTLLLLPWLYPTITPLFLTAVMVSYWYGDWKAGLLATVLSTLAINYFFIEPFYSLQILNLGTVVRLSTFLTAAGSIGLLNQLRRAALKNARENLQALQAAVSREQVALAEAKAARENLETVLSSINDGFYVLDRDWRFTYVNDRYCEIVKMQRSALLGQNVWELFADAVDTDAYVQFHRAISEQTPLQFDYFYLPLNCWHAHRIYPSPTGLTVFIAEITDRKQAEAALQESESRFRTLADNIAQFAWIADENGWIFWYNRRWFDYTGTTLEEMAGWGWQTVHHPEYVDRVVTKFRRHIETGEAWEDIFPLRGQDGQFRWFLSRAMPIRNEQGEVVLWFGTNTDIDDRKRAELNEQFLNQLDARLRQLSNADEMLWETMSWLGEYLNVDRCVWHAINSDNGLAIVEQEWRRQEVPSVIGVHRLSDFASPDLLVQYQAGQTVVVSDVTTNPYTALLAANYISFGTRALVAVSCLYEGRWVALLVVNARTVRHWLEDEVALLQEIVARLWSLIEHTRAVQQLRQSEAEFRQLANAMPQIVWVSNADGSLEFINDRWTEYTGLTLEQSRDRTLMEQLIPREDNQQLSANFVQAQETRSPYQSQFRLIRPDGSYVYFLTRAIPILDDRGQVRKWCGTSTDITELKQLEDELRQKNAILSVINESAPTPIFVKDRQGRIIFANPATLEVFGKSAAQVIGYRDCDLYPSSEDAARVMENDRRIMESGQMEVVEESPDGIRTFLGMKVPYRNEAGEVIGLIGISNDISDRVQTERDRERILQQEQAAREAAENANRIKDEFLAVLSHELRSPLNPILGWSKLLQTRKLDEAKTALALATIERNAKLQSELIEDLLDVSRILQGKLSLNPCPINLVPIIQAGLETVRLAAESKFIQIETHLDAEVGQVSGDAARLQQVVWNLLSNAVKFTPKGGRVEIGLNRTEDYAQITVRDTGKGIDPNFLPHVFDHFRQEDGATTRKFGGLGLGLAIVRHLVELHGGTVQAESLGEGKGATFTVRLPLMPIQPAVNLDSSSSESSFDLNGVQVLVIDDEKDSREFVAFVLEQAGAEVMTATSAGEGFAALTQFKPNVLLSDIGMPDMDGYMLIQQIRALSPEQGGNVIAIALTAYAGDFNQQQALQAGFQHHLAKPIEPNELIKTIAALIERNSHD
ncbi:PAS domain S-box protein [Argonema galeatum A003/A1]|nr:PAS domain S-box protein [Argonema galeatum]MCL1462943.1 PAS domain S-box protein [Argonema galeatum A003/A1]